MSITKNMKDWDNGERELQRQWWGDTYWGDNILVKGNMSKFWLMGGSPPVPLSVHPTREKHGVVVHLVALH